MLSCQCIFTGWGWLDPLVSRKPDHQITIVSTWICSVPAVPVALTWMTRRCRLWRRIFHRMRTIVHQKRTKLMSTKQIPKPGIFISSSLFAYSSVTDTRSSGTRKLVSDTTYFRRITLAPQALIIRNGIGNSFDPGSFNWLRGVCAFFSFLFFFSSFFCDDALKRELIFSWPVLS